MMKSDFDTFLSHNSKDKTAARDLKKMLEARQLRVWFDETEIRPGELFIPSIENGLRAAGSVTILIGSSGMGPFHQEETYTALSNAIKMGRPAIPVMIDGCDPSLHQSTTLFNRRYIDFRSGFHTQGIDELVWGITGEKQNNTTAHDATTSPIAIRWVLIAGSGGATPRPAKIDELSRTLGKALADSGFGLITGGWDGVDHITAEAFSHAILSSGRSLSGRLLQIMQSGRTPHYPAGRLINMGSDEDAWLHSIQRADAVILIGGLGGTGTTGEWAEANGKPVLPIVDSRGPLNSHSDAYRFYFKTLGHWDMHPLSNLISKEDYETLANPAPYMINDLIRILGAVTT